MELLETERYKKFKAVVVVKTVKLLEGHCTSDVMKIYVTSKFDDKQKAVDYIQIMLCMYLDSFERGINNEWY